MSEALNEIHAYFGKLNTTTTAPVKQWAYGQKLVIHDADLPNVFEAYYSNSRSRGEASPQIGTDGVVDAPHAYFRSGADIYVFLMVHEGQDDGRYNKIVHIPIDPCAEPSDVEPEPYEQGVIDQAIAVLNDAVEQTGEDKAATAALAEAAAASSLVATEAAQSAQGSATSASASATTATNAESTATTKASEAAQSAASAASAKTAAETAEANAKAAQTASESARASAESAVQTATAKASEASTSATSASGSASAASASASQASESATQAAASATAASGSATSAATSATTASTKASEASASATAAQTAQTAAEAARAAAETAAQSVSASAAQISRNAADITDLKSDLSENDAVLSLAETVNIPFSIAGTRNGIRFSTGGLISNSLLSYTDYINVAKYDKLTYRRIKSTAAVPTFGMSFYDKDKIYVSGERCIGGQPENSYQDSTISVPGNAVYARFSIRTDTETYGAFRLSGESKLYNRTKTSESPFKKDVKFGSFSSEWYKGQGDDYSFYNINTLYSEMITRWDALLNDSKGYMTKETIGTSSDNQTMYVYKLIPLRYRNNIESTFANNAPIFLIIPSIHGYEKSAAFGTYYFARDLVYNFDKNPVLNSIRTKAILYIVPVGNPYGFDNKTRKNANGVDLNRNWGIDPEGITDPTSPYYPGAEPFDQPETQAIKDVIDNSENLFFIVDYHTNGQYKAESWANVNWMTYAYAVRYDDYCLNAYTASQFQISEITENIQLEYNVNTGGESIGSITWGAESAPRPTIAYYGRTVKNIMGGTFEGNNGLPSEESAYSAIEQKVNSELIGNWIKNVFLIFKNAN